MTVSHARSISKEQGPNKWQVDKTIPLALVVATTVQMFGFIYWAGRLSVRFENLEESKMRQEERVESLSRTSLNIERSVARLESKVEVILAKYK